MSDGAGQRGWLGRWSARLRARLAQPLYGALLLAILVGATYSTALDHPFVFDDEAVVVRNPAMDSWSDAGALVRSKPTRALTNLSFLASKQAQDNPQRPRPYRLVNLFLHGLNGLLVLLLVRALLQACAERVDPSARGWIALFAAAVWVVHPLASMPVVYITQRYALLAATVVLGTALLYSRLRLAERAGEPSGPARWVGVGAVFLGVALGLTTKENAATLPLLLLLVEVLAFGGARWRMAASTLVVPFLGAALWISQQGWTGFLAGVLPPASPSADRLEYSLTQVPVSLFYLRLWLFPDQLSVEQDYPVLWDATVSEWAVPGAGGAFALGALGHGAILTLVALLLRRGERFVPLALGTYYTLLLVESSVVPILDPMVEHRAYLPTVLLAAALGYAVARGRSAFGRGAHRAPWIPAALGAALILGSSALTRARLEVWRDPVLLWEDVLAKRPDCPRALSNLGAELMRRERYLEAIGVVVQALSIAPNHPEGWANLGMTYLQLGQVDDAERTLLHGRWVHQHRRASGTPGTLFNNLGLVYLARADAADSRERGRRALRLASAAFQEALQHPGSRPQARRNLSRAEFLLLLGSADEEERERHATLTLLTTQDLLRAQHSTGSPGDPVLLRRCAVALGKLGRSAQAGLALDELLGRTVALAPLLRRDLAEVALQAQEQGIEEAPDLLKRAARALDGALRTSPRGGDLHLWRGRVAQAQGDAEAAQRHLRRGLELDPQHPDAARARALLKDLQRAE